MYTRIDADFAQEFFTTREGGRLRRGHRSRTSARACPVGASGTKVADFKVDDPALALVIDVTGSMGPEIGAIKTALNTMIDSVAALPVSFPLTTIVTFDDSATVRTVSRDPDRLRRSSAGSRRTARPTARRAPTRR